MPSYSTNRSHYNIVHHRHPNIKPGHVVPIPIQGSGRARSRVLLVLIVERIHIHGRTRVAAPGRIDFSYVTPGEHCLDPGQYTIIFIGPNGYTVQVLSFERGVPDDYLPEIDAESLAEDDDGWDTDDSEDSGGEWEEDGGLEEDSESEDGDLEDDDLEAGELDDELDDGELDDGELDDGELDDGELDDDELAEDGEFEVWEEWTPESVESNSTLPLYSPLPPPYASPPRDSPTAENPSSGPPLFESSPNAPRIVNVRTPIVSQRVSRSSTQRESPHSGARDDETDSGEGEMYSEVEDMYSDGTDSFSLAPGESALWAGTEGGPPIVPPRRDLPQPPTGTSMASVNDVQNPPVGMPPPASIASSAQPQPRPNRVRLSALDIPIRRPLSSTSSTTANSSTLQSRTGPAANSTSNVVPSATPRMVVASSLGAAAAGFSFRMPNVTQREAQQTSFRPVVGRLNNPNLFPISEEYLPTPQSRYSELIESYNEVRSLLRSPTPRTEVRNPVNNSPPTPQIRYPESYSAIRSFMRSPSPRTEIRHTLDNSSPHSADDARSPRRPMVVESHSNVRGLWNSPPHELARFYAQRELSSHFPQQQSSAVSRSSSERSWWRDGSLSSSPGGVWRTEDLDPNVNDDPLPSTSSNRGWGVPPVDYDGPDFDGT